MSSNLSYCVRKIAVVATDENPDCELFIYKKKIFAKLVNTNFTSIQLDVVKNKDFQLKIFTERDGREYLGLFFMPTENLRITRPQIRERLLHFVFKMSENVFSTGTEVATNSHNSALKLFQITNLLYQSLPQFHRVHDQLDPNVPENVQHAHLKPILRPYQSAAVRWAINREIVPETISRNFLKMSCEDIPDQDFYLHSMTLKLFDSKPADYLLPSGGILADEMGLGKTVEMLALILHNKRKPPLHSREIFNHKIEPPPAKKLKVELVHCICVDRLENKKLIECCDCGRLQHVSCVRKHSQEQHDEKKHKCPECWETTPLMESGSTIIVSPFAIKSQWMSEIQKHVSESFKVLNYEGLSASGWISPEELNCYDVVLTSYNVLQREIHHTNIKEYRFRNDKRYMRMPSPILLLRWWRVVLDEAQMVESSSTNAAQMVKILPAIHRWAVTGTPIQRSLNDIRGIFEFLDVYPFSDIYEWKILQRLYTHGDTQPLLNILGKLMWRTSKNSVLSELGIPPQTEQVHYVRMCDVQALFYRTQHISYEFAFDENIRKLAIFTESITNIDAKTLKLVLKPLLRLRQECTIPMLFQKSDHSIIKKLLQPNELLEHLKSTNEIECKTHLRTIVSSINGMAGIHILQNNFDKAIKCYKLVLKKAREQTGTVSVDTLLRIHALHNLIEVYQMQDSGVTNARNQEICKELLEENMKLEWKYLETYYSNFKKIKLSAQSSIDAVNDTRDQLTFEESNCWRRMLKALDYNGHKIQIIERINEEKRISFGHKLYADFRSDDGIDYLLTKWYDNLCQHRTEVLHHFKKLKHYTTNIKPKSELSPKIQNQMEKFVKEIFNCHLNKILQNESQSKKEINAKAKKRVCDLCVLEKLLAKYECVIFDKTLDERNDNEGTLLTEGTWNPSFQENVLRTIYMFAKNRIADRKTLQDFETLLQLIECYKKEYKDFSKLWIEVEYTVKAYDELDMCKMRLEFINSQQNDENDKSKKSNKNLYQISEHELELNYQELEYELATAEREFVRKSARLNYIKHLKSNSDTEEVKECPICTQIPDEKYTVLECGHHMCFMCFSGMSQFQKNYLTCAVCRNRQSFQNVYYVTLKAIKINKDDILIKGEYASKVTEIVRTVLFLRRNEPEVKIIIFSHWSPILGVIGDALAENKVEYRFKEPFNKAIKQFKSAKLGVTCLLLLLASGSKGLNLIEATHVFLVEPILNPGEEVQAIGRIHRIGQEKPTTVHRFIVKNTIEENIYNTVSNDETRTWENQDFTISNLKNFFTVKFQE